MSGGLSQPMSLPQPIGLAILLLAGLAALWALAVVMTIQRLTRPPRRTYASALARGKPGDPSELPDPREFRSWNFENRGWTLPVWEIDGDRIQDPAAPIVLMVHGWGDSRLGALARVGAVLPEAAKVIAFDLPGHGESSRGGVARGPTSLGIEDPGVISDLVQHLSRSEPSPRPVILFGWSLGAGASIAAAALLQERGVPVAAVIAESPYIQAETPARRVLMYYAMPHRFTLGPALAVVGWRLGVGVGTGGRAWHGFDRVQHAAKLVCPLLVIHGERDIICPIADGRAIASAARLGQIVELPEAGHNDIWTSPEKAQNAVRSFVGSLAPHLPRA